MVEVWRKARKKAVLVEFREVMGEVEIDKQIFAQTYEVVEEAKFISPLFCRWKKFLADVLDNCEGDEYVESLDSFDADVLSNLNQLEEYGVPMHNVEVVVRLKKTKLTDAERKFMEDFVMFVKNDAAFEAIAQREAKEQGFGELSKDELEWAKNVVLKSLKEMGQPQ